MKLATIPSQDKLNRDGDLVLVTRDLKQAFRPSPGLSLLKALESWDHWVPQLKKLSEELNQGNLSGAFDLDLSSCLSPLPRAPGFYDGSAFLSHVVRARRARGDQMPESAKVTPLMYQGVSDGLLPWNAPIDLMNPDFGGDFEAEFAVILKDTPKNISTEKAPEYFALFCLFNDITFREIVKQEIETKFGFLQSKPNSSFAPIVVTPDELGSYWDGKRFQLNIDVKLNGQTFGHPHGKEMHFSMGQLVAHAGRTRPLTAGTIVGTGTVSNESNEVGFACLTEKRFQEVIESGKPSTPWLKVGDRVEIDCQIEGNSVFGRIDEKVVQLSA